MAQIIFLLVATSSTGGGISADGIRLRIVVKCSFHLFVNENSLLITPTIPKSPYRIVERLNATYEFVRDGVFSSRIVVMFGSF